MPGDEILTSPIGQVTHIPSSLSLLSDQAIGESGAHDVDGLGFAPFARVLASAALGTRGPFTIGVFGEWGTGKTSLMRMIESTLDREHNVVTVWFNAWRYEQEEHPIVPLVGTIVRELEKGGASQADPKRRSLVRSLRAIAYGFSAKSRVKVPGFAEIEASFVAKDMIDRRERLTPDPLLDRSLYYGAFAGLEAVQLDEDFRIVIMIDDLDRCFPDQAIRLLESIKLVLSQPGFIFVLGVARKVIEGYLQHRYSTEYGIADLQGQLYLDKIVQLPFHIPPNVGRMERFSETMLERLSPDIGRQLKGVLPTIGEALGGNLRAVIRFINSILIDLAINNDLAERSDMEVHIPVAYFALSRCLQQRWPEIFAILVGSPDLAAKVPEWDRAIMRDTAAQPNSSGAPLAAALLSDRALETLLVSEQGKQWLTRSDLREASVSFLRTQQRISPLDETVESKFAYDAYISYHHQDRGAVSQIAEILADHGLRVFMDVMMAPGTDWESEFEKALTGSESIIWCWGATSDNSVGQNWEFSLAMGSAATYSHVRHIPILLPGSDPATLPESLRRYKWLDLRQGIDGTLVAMLAGRVQSAV